MSQVTILPASDTVDTDDCDFVCSSHVWILNLNGADSFIRLEKIQNVACFSFYSYHLLFPVFQIMFTYLFIFLTVLGLGCCTGFSLGLFSTCSVRASRCGGFSCCGAQALGHTGFSSWAPGLCSTGLISCGSRAQLLLSMWDLLRSGIEPVCSALVGGFFTTEPSGKPLFQVMDTPPDGKRKRYIFTDLYK